MSNITVPSDLSFTFIPFLHCLGQEREAKDQATKFDDDTEQSVWQDPDLLLHLQTHQ